MRRVGNPLLHAFRPSSFRACFVRAEIHERRRIEIARPKVANIGQSEIRDAMYPKPIAATAAT